MSRELTVAWELLNAVTRARQQLAAARPMIWERARLPTAERTIVLKATAEGSRWRPSADGDRVVIRVSVETHLLDGRRLTSCLDVIVSPQRWSVQPYIVLADGREQILWDGPIDERDDSADFLESIDVAARSLLRATMRLDFNDPARADIGELVGLRFSSAPPALRR
jgi:hypothetical protein